MEALIALLVVYLAVVLVALPIWIILKLTRQDRRLDQLGAELRSQQETIRQLRSAPPPAPGISPSAPTLAPAPVSLPVAPPLAPPPVRMPAPVPAMEPPPLKPAPAYQPPARGPVINWEQFMGAKLFAWLGGLALFLGVAFFVKYSFEHALIPPEVRVALGFLLGVGLVVGGLWIPRERYAITAQTLVGAGIVSLYAVTFACNSIYHFAFFGTGATFLLMTLITAAAFIVAVRLEAQVVAILGLLGGFLTPVLLATGQDNPVGLFGYVALLDLGLAALALHRRWLHHVPLAALGTIATMVGWAETFYTSTKAPVAMVVCLVFSLLFYGLCVVARRLDRLTMALLGSALALAGVSFAFAFHFMFEAPVAAEAGRLLGFIAAIDLVVLALVWLDARIHHVHAAAGLVVFGLLALWISVTLTEALLPWALGAALGFAALHTAFPLLLERSRPGIVPTWWSQLFPPLSLLVMLLPLFKLETPPFILWPAILLVDVLAIGLAMISLAIEAVGVVLVLTLVATAICIFRAPAASAVEPSLLVVIAVFAGFFFGAGLWLARRLGAAAPASRWAGVLGSPRVQLPAFASILPFLLLVMVCGRLDVPDPSAVFGLGLLLVLLTLGLTVLLRRAEPVDSIAGSWLPACALVGITAVELVWHSLHPHRGPAIGPLAWFIGFYLLFALYPFFFRRWFADLTGPWAVAALSGLVHFWVIYRSIKTGWPSEYPGVIPALFALAPLASLAAAWGSAPSNPAARLNQLAWFGGVALAFITLIFPIQFERQWLTVAWALEGAALLWLFRRVPHPGLRLVGVGLLGIVFVRLGLNHAVFSYHVRGETAVLNWYLYAYGLTIASLLAGARFISNHDSGAPGPEPRGMVLGIEAPPILNALGVILAFILLNIEVADYFTVPGARTLAFHFSGNFARDMSYTIAWALFALGLLGVGIWRTSRAARYAALGLLSVTLLKLFLHDLAQLEALYRIGALFAVAIIAILASLAYQRFLPGNESRPPPPAAP